MTGSESSSLPHSAMHRNLQPAAQAPLGTHCQVTYVHEGAVGLVSVSSLFAGQPIIESI
jgi:hypothetical protein